MDLGKYDKHLHIHWDDQLVYAYGLSASEAKPICLDLGCGRSPARNRFKGLKYRYVGTDIAYNEGVSVISDAHCLPFADEVFDVVYTTKVFEHLSQPWVAVNEIYRVLKIGGRIFGSVAFLEAFHNSYFHFTHYGVGSILEHAGFEVEALEPGYLGTTALCNMLFEPLKIGWIVKLPTYAVLWVRRKIAYPYAKLRYRNDSCWHDKARTLWSKDRYRFTGEISFLAVKR